MEKRLIVAIALSILVILLFQVVGPKRPPSPAVAAPPSIVDEGPIESIDIPIETNKGKESTIQTGRFILTFSNIGASLIGVSLKEYKDPSGLSPMQLISVQDKKNAVFAIESNELIPALSKRVFELVEKSNDKILYVYTAPGKYRIAKQYYFHNINDYIELRVSIQNIGTGTIYKDYEIIGGSSLKSTGQTMGRRFSQIDSMIDGKISHSGKVKDGEQLINGIVSWTGVKGRYFSAILKPMQESKAVILRQLDAGGLASGIRTKRIPIYPESAATDTYILYMGPNDAKRLSRLGFGLEQTISYGFFGGISKVMLAMLRTFHKYTRNWGVSIILLTLVVNAILFPLTRKSFMSMKKIQEVQPHIEKLRGLHKDNPQKLNKELAAVYKQYNVNPLGGCLPLLIQMPIFIALYQGLMRSIELKGATFMWIKDLSSPDSVQLPFSLPILGSDIHILPLLMVGAMFMQQFISTRSGQAASAEQKQQQKIMMIVFPLFFGFLFYKFPSGLVLYWLTNTVLMTTEHALMKKPTSSQ